MTFENSTHTGTPHGVRGGKAVIVLGDFYPKIIREPDLASKMELVLN